MNRNLDPQIRALVVEIVETSPTPPPFADLGATPAHPLTREVAPNARPRRRATRRAAIIAAGLVAAASVASTIWIASGPRTTLHSRPPSVRPGYQIPAGPPTTRLEIHALPTLRFNAKEYTTPAGVVQIDYLSEGGYHTLAIDDPRFDGFLLQTRDQGDLTSGNVLLAPGTYTIYCTVPGHRDAGHEAKVIVTPKPNQ